MTVILFLNSGPMHTLYISYDGMTDPLGQSQVIPYLSGLSKKGIKISLISFEKKEYFLKSGEVIQKKFDDEGIDWHPLSYTKKPPVLSTIRDVQRMVHVAKRLHLAKNFDVVHCRSYIASLAGLYMKQHFGTRFIFDMRGFWADERVEGGLWNLNNPLYKFVYRYFKKKEKTFLEQADCVISLTYAGAKEISSREDLAVTPYIEVIPCCADLGLFDPATISDEKKDVLRASLEISKTDKILSYLGSVGTWYLLEEMMAFFRKVLRRDPQYKFLFITPSDPELIRKAAWKAGVDTGAIIVCEATRKEVPALLSLSDFSIFFIKPTYSKKASSPVKQGEAMAMGIPIICNANIGDTDKVLEEYQCGLLLQDFTEQKLDEVAELLTTEARNFDATTIRKGALDYFSLEKGVEKYYKIYQQLGLNEV